MALYKHGLEGGGRILSVYRNSDLRSVIQLLSSSTQKQRYFTHAADEVFLGCRSSSPGDGGRKLGGQRQTWADILATADDHGHHHHRHRRRRRRRRWRELEVASANVSAGDNHCDSLWGFGGQDQEAHARIPSWRCHRFVDSYLTCY